MVVAALRRQLRWHSFCSSRELWRLAWPCRAGEEPNALPSQAVASCPLCTGDADNEQLDLGRERGRGFLSGIAHSDQRCKQGPEASLTWWLAVRAFSSHAAELAESEEQAVVLASGGSGSPGNSQWRQRGHEANAAAQTGNVQVDQGDHVLAPSVPDVNGHGRQQESSVRFSQPVFRGSCYNCGEKGHTRRNCPNPYRKHIKEKEVEVGVASSSLEGSFGGEGNQDQQHASEAEGGLRTETHARASSHASPAESVSVVKDYLAQRASIEPRSPQYHRAGRKRSMGREGAGHTRRGGLQHAAAPLDRRKEGAPVGRGPDAWGTRGRQTDSREDLDELKEAWLAAAATAEVEGPADGEEPPTTSDEAEGDPTASNSRKEKPALDLLVRAEAEALLVSMQKARNPRKELRHRLKEGVARGQHLAAMCSVLLDPGVAHESEAHSEELLVDVMMVLGEADMGVLPVADKWAVVRQVMEALVRRGSLKTAKRVVTYPPWQPTSRAQARAVLMSTLMRGEAYQEAVAVFEGALGACLGEGSQLEQLKACGRELVQGLIRGQQLALAAQVTELVSGKGDYGPFVDLIRLLGSQKRFLEAFYTLDKYCKAVETPDLDTTRTLAAQYAEHGYEQTGLEFLQFASQTGSTPHAHVVWVLVRAYGLAKLPHRAEEVVRLSAQMGAEADVDVEVALATAYLDAGDVSKAGVLLEDVVTRVPEGTSQELSGVLQQLLDAQCAAGNVGEGWQVLRWMDRSAIPYSIDSLTTLFEAVLQEGGNDVTQLMDAFDGHRRFLSSQRGSSKVGTLLHKSLFQFLVGKGLLEDAVAVFEAGLKDGVSVPLTNCVRLIFDLIEAGHPSVALEVLNGAPELEREYPRLYYKLVNRLTGRGPVLPAH